MSIAVAAAFGATAPEVVAWTAQVAGTHRDGGQVLRVLAGRDDVGPAVGCGLLTDPRRWECFGLEDPSAMLLNWLCRPSFQPSDAITLVQAMDASTSKTMRRELDLGDGRSLLREGCRPAVVSALRSALGMSPVVERCVFPRSDVVASAEEVAGAGDLSERILLAWPGRLGRRHGAAVVRALRSALTVQASDDGTLSFDAEYVLTESRHHLLRTAPLLTELPDLLRTLCGVFAINDPHGAGANAQVAACASVLTADPGWLGALLNTELGSNTTAWVVAHELSENSPSLTVREVIDTALVVLAPAAA